ncbi:MAG: glucose-6-phosphate isomerase [Ruminococcaceae bacterium]|nr:glucose-6-phosphate isomerase [Oscillospiraceae bacterium]
MLVELNQKYVTKFVGEGELDAIQSEITKAASLLDSRSGEGSDFLGWVDLPENYNKAEFAAIKEAAEKIKKSCDILVVIGIGGSYLGARAVIEFLRSPLYNNLKKDTPDIYFAGNSISATALSELLSICEGKDVCINVISKSGTTTEPAVAFRVFRDLLEKKYGKDGARERIFVTTDKEKGTLKSFSDKSGYQTFVVPDDVGGRFSVLTAVGLLPIAVAGINIDKLMEGANLARKELCDTDINKNDCYKYAAIRNILLRKGKSTEIFVAYEPFAQMLSEWWKQLYGESEGKDGKGIYPSSVIFSTDLHSLGQYIQDGQRNIFETVLNIKETGAEMIIPNDENNVDGLNFLSGKDLDFVNKNAMKGTLLAHMDGNVPNIVIDMEKKDELSLGYLIYFFEKACAISGYTLGVNPFNQPGVEAYKKNMFALLGKPGYEEQKKALEERLK